MNQWVYSFGDGTAQGNAGMKNLLGGKGANLAEMCLLGLPVPPGFTLSTEVCTAFYQNNRHYPEGLKEQVADSLHAIEKKLGCVFGDAKNPLLVSVRSGARASMPGMMDTILNLGLNDQTVIGLATQSNNERFAYDSYRRFIQMYSDVVLGVDHYHFEEILDELKRVRGVTLDTELNASDLKELVAKFKAKVEEEYGSQFPQDVHEQLWGSIGAVLKSWMNPRANTYRRLHEIPESWGTAVNVQSMVFGNMGDDCATGVAFTRDPSTGEKLFYGEYLINAQGEDVVAGIRTPAPITIAAKHKMNSDLLAMEETLPEVYQQLVHVYEQLEKHYRDMQDIEFTVQKNKLWVLQTRSGKRTAAAAVHIAVDMVNEGLIDKEEALNRIDPLSLDQLLHPTLDPKAHKQVMDRGLPASPGAACGKVVFNAEDAELLAGRGEKVILVRIETSPEDIHGMHAAEGILTARGGMTSHAAVVARGMGKPCVSGAGGVRIDYKNKVFTAGGLTVRELELITINGTSGEVMYGEVPTIQPQLSDEFMTLMQWADETRELKVRTNAETPLDAQTARRFGAEGIGLCRTEHMFFDAERIIAVREMILASTVEGRELALAKILPMQKGDFKALFAIMAGLPVTIRLLDPPLHEFLPHTDEEMKEVASHAGVTFEEVKHKALALAESNPMLGHRGCRLGISYPEIYAMQARAIFEATAEVFKEENLKVIPEIMIPLVLSKKELDILKEVIDRQAEAVTTEKGIKLDYIIGTMIELPRAALRAGDIAETAEFFSFGTNDLTQTTMGISRDDCASFLGVYKAEGILEHDPFVRLDEEGVGELVQIAAERGRKTRPDLKLGICGEHGGNPPSIAFCQSVGLNYVSCSPYRVPIARLAAAQAVIRQRKAKLKAA
ncbi:MAG: pyruvate, phosphate dikinase [Alphaproteobacteria bacterium]|nr:pyruvate, phosphate dikinase [Alphaproteobacteria bacterium]